MGSRKALSLATVRREIIHCDRCPRLRSYCIEVGRTKKASFRDHIYWAKPVPGFGDPNAELLILGLAPAAHGANRTGRVFTGDGVGASGDFLMAALHQAGFSNITTSQTTNDGLVLRNAYIAAAVRCAPPANKPLPEEVDACLDHLAHEVRALPRLRAVVALGRIAWDAWLKLLTRNGVAIPRPRPAFAHSARLRSEELSRASARQARFRAEEYSRASARHAPTSPLVAVELIGCFHPSRQNTNTGKVTPAMYESLFGKTVRDVLDRRVPPLPIS
jgi:uracil-DNA glycosylase